SDDFLVCGTDPTPSVDDITVEASCDLDVDVDISEPVITLDQCDMIYTYTITATDECGRSTSCEWVRTEECPCDPYCTVTQGFYGNPGGLYCDGESTSEVLEYLMSLGALTIGRADLTQSFTVQPGEWACILLSLPGGGDPEVLGPENGSYDADCLPSNIQHTDGVWDNTLAAQTLTLSLNVRIPDDPMGGGELIDLEIEAPCFSTWESTDCDNEGAEPILTTLDTFCIPEAVYNALVTAASPNNPTVGDLLDLANSVLGGVNDYGLALGDVTEALKAINNGFDFCRIVSEYFSTPPPMALLDPGILQTGTSWFAGDVEIASWPSPTRGEINILINTDLQKEFSVVIFDRLGKVVRTDGMIAGHKSFDLSHLDDGLYFIRVTNSGINYTAKVVKTE
ncbi:MAG: T9SS type A sorting domain-containing protein, partial [Saprospiraceae bacterium]|nr:T9SS type A sorting domain-containing protein [Saprospiraceae bacterium]